MSDLNDARKWHQTVSHLVQAHGADHDRLIAFAPTLEQLSFAHSDTHAALALIGTRPPDGHTHTAPLDPGHPESRPPSYRPFPPTPEAGHRHYSRDPSLFPSPRQTGLPHTGDRPLDDADLAAWTSSVVSRWTGDSFDRLTLECIKPQAAAAAARWLARADCPPVTRARPGRGRPSTMRARQQHVPRQVRGR